MRKTPPANGNNNAHRWIGFDLDHTLVEFDNDAIEKIMYDSARKTLATRSGANDDDDELVKAGLARVAESPYEKHLTSKGMVIDIANGNLLILDEHKRVKLAFHGTTAIKPPVVEEGTEGKPPLTLSDDFLALLDRLCFNLAVGTENDVVDDGKASSSKRLGAMIHTNFDRPIGPAFAHAVDGIDDAFSKMEESPKKAAVVMGEVYDAAYHKLVNAFLQSQSGFTPTSLSAHLQDEAVRAKLIRKQKATRSWLAELRKRGFNTFLLSDAKASHVDNCMCEAYGADWRTLFDLVVCDAKKTAFFSAVKKSNVASSAFAKVDWAMNANREVSGGHYLELLDCLDRKPREGGDGTTPGIHVTYFGDHLAKDVVAPKLLKLPNWRAVAVVKEKRSSSSPFSASASEPLKPKKPSPLTLSPSTPPSTTPNPSPPPPGSPLQLAVRLLSRTFSSPRLSARRTVSVSSVSSADGLALIEETIFFPSPGVRSYFHATLDAYADACYSSLSEAASRKLFLVNEIEE